MSISPIAPSRLAPQADPAEPAAATRRKAQDRLPGAAPAPAAPDDLIAAVMAAADPAAAKAAYARLEGLPGATDTATGKAITGFEAVLLTQFVDAMLPKDDGGLYGTGTAGRTWKSFHASHMAEVLADRGILGMDQLLERPGKCSRPITPFRMSPET